MPTYLTVSNSSCHRYISVCSKKSWALLWIVTLHVFFMRYFHLPLTSACLLCTAWSGLLQIGTIIHTVFVFWYLLCAIDNVNFYCYFVYPVKPVWCFWYVAYVFNMIVYAPTTPSPLSLLCRGCFMLGFHITSCRIYKPFIPLCFWSILEKEKCSFLNIF